MKIDESFLFPLPAITGSLTGSVSRPVVALVFLAICGRVGRRGCGHALVGMLAGVGGAAATVLAAAVVVTVTRAGSVIPGAFPETKGIAC